VAELSERARSLVEAPNLAFLATVNPDGSPQVTPVWIDREDGRLVVNTAVGRVKDRNMRRDPRVSLTVVNRADDYARVDVRGRVVEIVEGEEAERHIDKLAKKYLGRDEYPWRSATERRVVFKIEPVRIYESG
jgi:PPOX class probable F420-dependent enzyme